MIALGPPGILEADAAVAHPIVWSKTTVKRLCRATLMAETFASMAGVGVGSCIRADTIVAR